MDESEKNRSVYYHRLEIRRKKDYLGILKNARLRTLQTILI